MTGYTYGRYVYFKNMADTPNEHHNQFILNQMQDFHITSPFKLSNDICESFPKLCANKMIEIDKITCLNCGSVIKSQCMEQK